MRLNLSLSSKLYHPITLYLIMVVLGILSGLSGISYLQIFGSLISDIFIKIFKFISTPLIALSIIVTLATYCDKGGVSNLWRKTFFYTLSTTLIAATVSCILYLLINPQNIHQLSPVAASAATASQMTYLQHLLSLIPSNIFSPFMEHQVIGVLLIGLMIGVAIRYIPDKDAKHAITLLFKGIYGLFLVITKWVIAILPLGLYGFITTTVVELNNGLNMTGIGAYLAIIVLANVVQGCVILPLWLSLNRINPIDSARKMMPALSIAFFSKSSAGTLPVTMETAEKKLNIRPQISRFVLPLCTSINMNGCAAFIFVTVIYLMQNQGLEITLATMACWIVIATIAAIGNAGVPMGCFFLSASLLSSMNVPIVLLGLILPFYSLIDMVETTLNVWSDSCVANVVNKQYSDDTTIAVTAPNCSTSN